jgi:ketosteroid isomerase-like protein
MSESSESEAVRRLRRGYDAFNRGDFDAAVAEMHSDIEWERAEHAPETTPVKGIDAVRAWMMPDVFEDQHVTLEEVIENGDKIFVQGLFRIRARGSGIEISDRAWHVWTVRGDKVARLEFFQGRSEALAAAGLR